ncbi:MAG: Gfo/Idh/MocA family oxidoreductase [Acidobacteria bacterium]|nr:Gfo/Idh/MocA family oxidoreductase [Acidobacteriota bacterium]
MTDPTRRTLLQGAALTALSRSRIWGANERINMVIVGVGGRGTGHVREYLRLPECQVAAICDVNQAAQERAVAIVEKDKGHKPKVYTDMREAFADKDIDAVSIATPNHWHVLASLWAVQAGKDVYVEKPVSHNVFEARQLLAAARKYNRMVQVGHQSRSIEHKRRAMELLQQGVIGKVYMSKGLCYKRRPSIGRKPDGPVPPGINWDLFLGPAPMRAFNENRFKYNWHWFWDTGNGDIGNQGVHEMDVAFWGLGKNAMPKSVVSTGGKYVYDDDQETPNTQLATFDYGDAELVFEVRGLVTGEEGGLKVRGNNVVGNLFYGSEGFMAVDGAGFQVYKGEKREQVMDEKSAGRGDTSPHMANFLAAVKSRRHRDLHADIEIAQHSASLCHLANISYRLGRKLAFDPSRWQFAGDREADKMLTREYRKPYVVPEKV